MLYWRCTKGAYAGQRGLASREPTRKPAGGGFLEVDYGEIFLEKRETPCISSFR